MNATRFLSRFGAFLLTLALVDLLGPKLMPASDLTNGPVENYRLPDNQETGFLQSLIDRQRVDQGQPQVTFLGSSPTYGVTIQNPAHTYAASFSAYFKRSRPQSSVYNFAAKGFLAADLNSIMRATIAQTDAYVIQLNYHTFSPKLLASTPIRHPDLPERLGTSITLEEAKLIGTRPTPLFNWNAAIRQQLRAHWWFYRERERLALQFLGQSPERWLYDRFFPQAKAEATQTAQTNTDTSVEQAPETKPFYELKNAQQVSIVKRYAENTTYELTDDNIEWRFVKQMLKQLKAQNKPAVFFIAPINADALRFYEVMDWKQYQHNVAKLRQSIEAEGFGFIDINLSQPLPEDLFADISHTLDEGGKTFGPLLYRLSSPYWEKTLK